MVPPPVIAGGIAGPMVRYAAFAGGGVSNVVRIEGTSSLHAWQVEGHLIGGSAEFGPGLPTRPGILAGAERVEARVSAFIPVRSLKSVQANGRPYSDAMDEDHVRKLARAGQQADHLHANVAYAPGAIRGATNLFVYDATGELTVAGKTNTITMPVTVSPSLERGRIQFAGSIKVKVARLRDHRRRRLLSQACPSRPATR